MRERVLHYLNSGSGDPEALAIALFHAQRAASPLYAALTARADGSAPDPQGWDAIPALPVSLFKELPVRSFAGAPGRTFLTSGTTGAARGVHALQDTLVYDTASWRHFRMRVPNMPARVVSLCPSPEGDSSLGHMIGHFARQRDAAPVQMFDAETGVNPSIFDALSDACFLATTAFSLDAALQQPGAALLDSQSVVMVTGGFKGRRVRLDSAGLYAAISERLGSPRVVGEYGMTELCSQLWTEAVPAGAVPGPFIAPPWLHVYAIDPITAAPVDGEGILRFVDLANTDSAVAIETMDLGVVERSAEGDRVSLRGRAAGADLRGCSLRAEDLLHAAR
jgi:hypothetical protein